MKHRQTEHGHNGPAFRAGAPAKPPNPSAGAYCAYCGAVIPKGKRSCLICGSLRGREPSIPPVNAESASVWSQAVVSPAEMRRDKHKITALALIMITVMLVCGASTAAFEYFSYQSIVSQFTAAHSAVYYTLNGDLKINIATQPEPAVITSQYSSLSAPLKAQASYDKRFIAYLNDYSLSNSREWQGSLRLLDLISVNDETSSNEGILVEADVIDFRFLPRTDRLFYLTGDGGLFLCDFSQLKNALKVGARISSVQIDSGVKGFGEISGRYILYYKGERADSSTWKENLETETGRAFDLYVANFEDASIGPAAVSEGVYRVEDYTREFERLIYTKRTRSPPLAMYDVFVFSRRDVASSQIAKDARHIVDASALKGAVLALAPSEETLTFRDLIDDDMLEADQSMAPPTPEEFGYNSSLDYDMVDPSVLDEIFDKYDEAMERYQEKLRRDQLRKNLRARLRAFMQDNYLSFGLYYTDGASTLMIADHIYNTGNVSSLAWGDADNDAAAFVTGGRESLERAAMSSLSPEKVAEMSQPDFDITGYMSAAMVDSLWLHSSGSGALLVFETAERKLSNIYMQESGGELYFTSTPVGAASGTLYYAGIINGSAGSIIHVDEDVAGYAGSYAGGLCYLKNTKGSSSLRDIAAAVGGGVKLIASGVEPDGISVHNAAGVISYYRTPAGQNTREFYVYESQERFISQSVAEASVYDSGFLYLLRSGSGLYKSLYSYGSGGAVHIDDNVIEAVFIS